MSLAEVSGTRAFRVLNLGRSAAAAFCARILGQLGADVQWLDARAAYPPPDLPPLGGGEDLAYDVVISDLRPSEAETLGLPLLGGWPHGGVAVSITPFGLHGPDVERPDEGPILGGCREDVAAALTGAHAAVAALAALRWYRRRRRPVAVEVATVDVLAACLGDALPRVFCPRGARDERARAADPGVLVLPCADGYVGVPTLSSDDRSLLAGLTGLDAVRAASADLASLLAPWLRTRTREEIFAQARLWRLPLAPALTAAEVLDDPQCAARGVWSRARGGPPVARSPFRVMTPSADLTGAGARGDERIGGSPPATRGPGSLPLSDLRVLDLGMVWAGPYCGRLLAGLGARVTKIEGPTRRDGTRRVGRDGCAGAFGDLNRGKSSLVLDLAHPTGRELFLRLAAQSDLVVESFSPRVMPNLGLAYEALLAANPSLLMLSMPAFGASGPWGNAVAYGGGLELATGLASLDAGGQPQPSEIAYLDYLAGCYGAAGLLAALLRRDRTGSGAHVEVAQREVACQVLQQSLELSGTSAAGAPRPGPAFGVNPAIVVADEHLTARGLLADRIETAGRGMCHHYARLPWRLHGVPARPERAAPRFGADSRRLLQRQAGLSRERLDQLVETRVVGVTMPKGPIQ
jgi:crotonobetainyl-CoA:carnitine CoA-transferase CaiB-like acyl-CoA transferase